MRRFNDKTALVFLLAGIMVPYWAGPSAAVTYGGRASGIVLDPASQPRQTACDSGELPPGGGSLSDTVSNPRLSGGNQVVMAANASVTASAGAFVSQCESQVQGVTIQLVGQLSTTITATSAGCVAVAACVGLSGESRISGLAIGGVAVVVTGEANQTVQIPGVGTLVINEQVYGSGEIRCNALRVRLSDSTEVVVGSARASISDCAPLPTRRETWGKVKSLYR